ncbi:MAG TPA: ABC transporter permease [Gaiellaceae bacterium]|jgi:NitT/TauT family transport system permease protein
MTALAVRRGAANWAPALIVAIAVVGLWEGIVKGAHIQRFLLPAPDAIWSAFRDNQSALWHEGWFTFQEALGGFALGCGFAILFAIVVARWNLLGSALMPYAIAANAIPIIAFAPITNAWFDPLTKTSKMVIAAVLCFFPVFVNTVRGLKSVKPQQLELMRSYAVGELTVFRLVRIPTALPFVFTALRVASVLAMIGAIVGEYYGGSLESLGANINQDASLFQFEKAWAEIVIACIFGIGFYLAVALAERFATRWQPRVEAAGA